MIETCKDCRHCRRITNAEKVWDKDGLHVKTWLTYFCTAFKVEVPPINRCERINKPHLKVTE